MDIAKSKPSALPTLAVELPPLEGENLKHDVLVPIGDLQSAEEVWAKIRSDRPASSLRFHRHYYLAETSHGRFALKYMWNRKDPTSDQLVGMVEGENFPLAVLLLSQHVAGCFLPGIRWELYTDREGQDPLGLGRIDPWDLLRGLTEEDVQRAYADHGVSLDRQGLLKCDGHYYDSVCPQCKQPVSVFVPAFDIDSAQCADCGVRPILSKALGRHIRLVLPSATGSPGASRSVRSELFDVVQWMGRVNAGVVHLHHSDFPNEWTPHQALQLLLRRSLLAQDVGAGHSEDRDQLLSALSEGLGSEAFAMVHGAMGVISRAVDRGGPFTPLEAQAAQMLATALKVTSD